MSLFEDISRIPIYVSVQRNIESNELIFHGISLVFSKASKAANAECDLNKYSPEVITYFISPNGTVHCHEQFRVKDVEDNGR